MDDMLKQIVEAATEAVAKNVSKAGNALTTGYIDRSKAEKKAISDGKIAVTHTATQQLTDKMKEIGISEEYARMALRNEAETIVIKRSILDKIFGRTKHIIDNTQQDNKVSDQAIGEINDDWLNRFRDVACLKSSEEAQEYFSKVLAGEIRKPGSFSLKALTTLADMDQDVAMYFKVFCSMCLVNLDDPNMYNSTQSKDHFKIKDARIPIIKDITNEQLAIGPRFSGNSSQNIEKSKSIYLMYGFSFEQFQLLMEYDLIIDHTSIDSYTFWYNNELWGFIPKNASTPILSEDQKHVKLTGYALTNVGIELFKIVEFDTPPQYWERISNFLKRFYNVNLFKYPKPRKKSPSDGSADPNPTTS